MRYFIIAGERSGDEHGSVLVQSLRTLDQNAIFRGYGGDFLENSGVSIIRNYASFSTIGVKGVFSRLNFYRKLLNSCSEEISEFQPDFLIVIDFSGFNLRLIQRVKNAKIIYFIPPKVWAWGRGRADMLRKFVDLTLVIFPFEERFLVGLGCENVSYFGNPTKWKIQQRLLQNEEKRDKSVALLPGSRKEEVESLVPVFCQLIRENPQLNYSVAGVGNLPKDLYNSFLNFKNVSISWDDSTSVLGRSKIAVIASGTATLEACLLNVPQVVVYKTNKLTFLAAKLLLKTKYISLVNILANTEVVRELIQKDCTSANIASEIRSLQLIEKQKKISEGYSEISKSLGDQNPFEKAAEAILALRRP